MILIMTYKGMHDSFFQIFSVMFYTHPCTIVWIVQEIKNYILYLITVSHKPKTVPDSLKIIYKYKLNE